MSLESKLAEVPNIIDRLSTDSGFQYGKPWADLKIAKLRCLDLVSVVYREAGIIPEELSLPPYDSTPGQLIPLCKYDRFEDFPIGHFICTRSPKLSHARYAKYPATHVGLKYSETKIASLSRKNEPLSIEPYLKLLSEQVLITRESLGALKIDEKGRYFFPKGCAEKYTQKVLKDWTTDQLSKLPALLINLSTT